MKLKHSFRLLLLTPTLLFVGCQQPNDDENLKSRRDDAADILLQNEVKRVIPKPESVSKVRFSFANQVYEEQFIAYTEIESSKLNAFISELKKNTRELDLAAKSDGYEMIRIYIKESAYPMSYRIGRWETRGFTQAFKSIVKAAKTRAK
jgi:hypothetical protein